MTPLLGNRLFVYNGHLVYRDDQGIEHDVHLYYPDQGEYKNIITVENFLELLDQCHFTEEDLRSFSNGRFLLSLSPQLLINPKRSAVISSGIDDTEVYEGFNVYDLESEGFEASDQGIETQEGYPWEATVKIPTTFLVKDDIGSETYDDYGVTGKGVIFYITLPDDYDPSELPSQNLAQLVQNVSQATNRFRDLFYRAVRNLGLYGRMTPIPPHVNYSVTEGVVRLTGDDGNYEVFLTPDVEPEEKNKIFTSDLERVIPKDDEGDPWRTCSFRIYPNATHINLNGLSYIDERYLIDDPLPKDALAEITFKDHLVVYTDLNDGIDTENGISIHDLHIDSQREISQILFYYEIANSL